MDHHAQDPHPALGGGDPFAQDVLACIIRVERDDLPEAPLDPRSRRGGRDMQLGEQVGIPTADDLLLDTMIVGPPFALSHDDRRGTLGGHDEQAVQWQEAFQFRYLSQLRANCPDRSAT